ncbi:hypothetical protein OSB04_016697 [Centaurea solstitialis]|uniref:Integrase catalytic domain-containing protein n=1 Tax=Centaurea solstitialis TaxID=347529 RepID=A0AA38W8R3_9ASTR|nr:hypothetical protein OSB04_016697 [Centaurea solstitialis]
MARSLGHVNPCIISILNKQGHLSVLSIFPNPTLCGCCKSHKLPFNLDVKHCSNPLDVVNGDIWGPTPITTMEGYEYYIVFIDDYSRFVWLYPTKLKSECVDIFIHFQLDGVDKLLVLDFNPIFCLMEFFTERLALICYLKMVELREN